MRLNASGHQSENERQLKKFNYSEQKNIYSISSTIRVLIMRTFHVLVEKYAALNIFNKQDSFVWNRFNSWHKIAEGKNV